MVRYVYHNLPRAYVSQHSIYDHVYDINIDRLAYVGSPP